MLQLAALFSLIASATEPAVDLTSAPGVETAIVTHGQGYFPVLDKTPDGRAVVILRGGGGHLGLGGRLDLFFSSDGLLWTGKRTAVDTAVDDRNPAFGITSNGRFLLGIHHQASYNGDGVYDPSSNLARDLQTWSDDEGVTWSNLETLRLGLVETHSPYGRIIRLSDGTYLQNVYGAHAPEVPNMPAPEEGVRDYAYVARSTDEGRTWGDPSLVASGHNETALIQTGGQTLLAAGRADSGGAPLDLFRSEDLGRTWSLVQRITDRSQHPADFVDLGEGGFLILFGNRRDKEKDIRGILSLDGGESWQTDRQIRLTTPVDGDFGYPSGVVMGDQLLIVHYWAGNPKTSYDGSSAQSRATLVPIKAILGASE